MKRVSIIIFIVLLFIPNVVLANSAEPPSLIILCSDAPEELQVFLKQGDREVELWKRKKFGEVMFVLRYSSLQHSFSSTEYTFIIRDSNNNFSITINDEMERYNNVYQLDYSKQTMKQGKSIIRSIALVGVRVSMTLVIEGLILFIFGYRSKKTWMAFLKINLLTQGALNIWINTMSPISYYIIFALILAEILIVFVELGYLIDKMDEMDRGCAIFAIISVNIVSFLIGAKVIPLLPI